MPTLLQKQTIYDTSMYLKLKKYLYYWLHIQMEKQIQDT
jgi:hypothetical protein